MKKIIISVCCFMTLSLNAAIYITTCGHAVGSVDQEFFETYGAWFDYMGDLNEIYCGTRGFGMVIEEMQDPGTYILK